MAAPAAIVLLVGVDAAWTPYPALSFVPETNCTTTNATEFDPLDEDFGIQETTTCVTAAGWDTATASVGTAFPALTAGFAFERDRVRLTALVTMGPPLTTTRTTAVRELTPDLAMGGQLALEGVLVNRTFSVAAGGIGSLRGFGAHGTHEDSGDSRLSSELQLAGGPALSLGWSEPGLLLRGYGVYTTAGEFGAGATFTWAPVVLPE
ncbi:MAG: hypothetical protein EXR71_06580 [Myxococcales bacterium]|nr:hypothetical protein [Myxococcales bacterium]